LGYLKKELLARLQKLLPANNYELLVSNRLSVLMEPRVAAAAFAYAAVLDRMQYGTLPGSITGDVLRDQAANVAAALSTKPGKWAEFWSEIPVNATDRLEPFVKGIALGWQMRTPRPISGAMSLISERWLRIQTVTEVERRKREMMREVPLRKSIGRVEIEHSVACRWIFISEDTILLVCHYDFWLHTESLVSSFDPNVAAKGRYAWKRHIR
jgi:hypothetical protein